jgi:hypothetical protein
MADNVNVTAGAGTTIATDQCGTDHYQKIKLADGLADSTTMVGAGGGVEATALRVTVATDSTGVLSVDDNGGILTVDGTVTANLSATDNAVLDVLETNTDSLAVVGGGVEATALRVTLANDSTGVITVDGTVTANLSATDNAVLDSIQAAVEVIDNIVSGTEAQVDVVAALPAGTNLLGKVGIDQVTANANEVVVKSGTVTTVTSITNAVAVTNAGITSIETNTDSLAVVGGGAEATALRVTLANDSTGVVTIDGTVTASNTAGDIASDSADSGNPVKVGAKAVNMDSTVPGTAVAEADRANNICDLYGRLLVDEMHPNFWSVAANYTEAQTALEVKATPGANLSLYITDIVISNGATAGNIRLLEDTAAAVDKTGKMYFAINGGAALHFKTPIKLTANKNLGITSVTCTTHSVTVSGYIAP